MNIQYAGVVAAVKGIGLENTLVMAAGPKVGILLPEYSIITKKSNLSSICK